jgi:hypothetical protein
MKRLQICHAPLLRIGLATGLINILGLFRSMKKILHTGL